MRKIKKEAARDAEVLTASEVAQWLRIPKSTLYKLCQEGDFPAVKIGRHWRFDRRLVDEWLRKKMTKRGR